MKILDAYKIASRAHAGQFDQAGRPYIEHLSRVFLRVAERGGDRDQQIAALLHDVIEDGRRTREQLEAEAVPPGAISLVLNLTRSPSEPYIEYVARCAAEPRLALIKRSDLEDNSDPERLAALDPATAARLRAKYERALVVMGDAGLAPQERLPHLGDEAVSASKRDVVIDLALTLCEAAPSCCGKEAVHQVLLQMYDVGGASGIWGGSRAALELGYQGHPDSVDLLDQIASDLGAVVESKVAAAPRLRMGSVG